MSSSSEQSPVLFNAASYHTPPNQNTQRQNAAPLRQALPASGPPFSLGGASLPSGNSRRGASPASRGEPLGQSEGLALQSTGLFAQSDEYGGVLPLGLDPDDDLAMMGLACAFGVVRPNQGHTAEMGRTIYYAALDAAAAAAAGLRDQHFPRPGSTAGTASPPLH